MDFAALTLAVESTRRSARSGLAGEPVHDGAPKRPATALPRMVGRLREWINPVTPPRPARRQDERARPPRKAGPPRTSIR